MARLSENISAILESLLKDYNNQVRPGFKEGKITTIRMNMLIRSMGPITEKEMKYSMDCYLRQEWHDSRLKFKGPLQQLTLNIKMLEALWKPDTYFHNGHGSYVHTITRPNKLFRIDQNGKILYSMRLTIKAKCPMKLRNFPMDKQSCPLLIGSYAYSIQDVKYEWDRKLVSFEPDMTLSQYDLLNTECQNYSAKYRKGGVYSVLQVNFNLQRHTGYFLIQVYIPCILIVVLSWVSFWINREATSDRVGLGITTVLTLSTISLDSRTDLPKVHYATALDWFILMSFGYCIATLLQIAAVHYFTKLDSGEVPLDEDEWQDIDVREYFGGLDDTITLPSPLTRSPGMVRSNASSEGIPHEDFPSREDIIILNPKFPEDHDKFEGCIRRPPLPYLPGHQMENYEADMEVLETAAKRKHQCHCSSLGEASFPFGSNDEASPPIPSRLSVRTTETQTDSHDSFWSQLFHCITGNEEYRKERMRQAIKDGSTNSVSMIDTVSRVLFPASYGLLNLWYWYSYYHTEIEYTWSEPGFDHFDHSYIK